MSSIALPHPSLRSIAITVFGLVYFVTLFVTPSYADLRNGMDADVVIGQPNFTVGTANNGGLSARTLSLPGNGLLIVNEKLIVSDWGNSRVLIWNKVPTENFFPADVVLGQRTFTTATLNLGGLSASSLSEPAGIATDGIRLFVADRNNSRILIWNQIPTENFAPANVVLGQPNFTSGAANNGGLSARSLSIVRGVATDGKRLYAVDSGNSRVLIWNKIPTENFTPADIVIGQPNFTSGTANGGLGVRSARGFSLPLDVTTDGIRIMVSEWDNRRVMIWNKIPSENFTPADVVLGQPDFKSADPDPGGIGPHSIGRPEGLSTDGKFLAITSQATSRIAIWTPIPTENFAPATFVLGQHDFFQPVAGETRSTTWSTIGVFVSTRRIAVTDVGSNRVLIFNVGESSIKGLGPQFGQGKAVVGKVFWDLDGNGEQDLPS